MLRFLSPLLALTALAFPGPLARPATAQDGTYDMDCAVILCMAGGFPAVAECDRAYDYMIDRITDHPPKSPFGVCSMADGRSYDGYDLDYAIGYRGAASSYSCPAGTRLHLEAGAPVTAFCYQTIAPVIQPNGLCVDSYRGITAATFRQFRAELTVEPGTDAEWAAPETVIETEVAPPARYETPCGGGDVAVVGGGDEGVPPAFEDCVPAWSPPATEFCDFAFPLARANLHDYDLSDPRMERVSCGPGPDGGTAMAVRQYAGAEVSLMSIGRHAFPEAMKAAEVVRLSAEFYIPSSYDWTYAGRLPLGINVGPWTSGGKTGARQSGSSIRLHVWPDNGGTLGIYSYNFDRSSSGAVDRGVTKQWGQGAAKVTARLPRDQWITVVLELALDSPGADRDAAGISLYDAAGRLIGADSSGPRLTYRRAGDDTGFTGAIFDDKLNSSAARAARNQQYYVRNWQGQACGR
ncbi:hypothetical protein [Amaricoccus solimangrovi]|uniref:Uncharacterized protein n=1 Tax=Amaricoccus solimangrovi TaxID=2589815 RepID=A0A501WES4_9RHOB|nr:hypothetical protein [Amaricoccus solimangrovi]TPE47322.1 hypothetical protein FJM51_20295 [Amaricoccus solimangrovi]